MYSMSLFSNVKTVIVVGKIEAGQFLTCSLNDVSGKPAYKKVKKKWVVPTPTNVPF